MFRLANNPFLDDEELHKLATYCLTETIKNQLKNYFEAGWQHEPAETLWRKFKIDRLFKIVPTEVLMDLERIGVDPALFFAKKVAQMMTDLKSEKEITFDVVQEYLLANMIRLRRSRGASGIAPKVQVKMRELEERIYNYVVTEYEEEGYDEIFNDEWVEGYEEEALSFLTQFSSLLDYGEYIEMGYAFWDHDFEFINHMGISNFISRCAIDSFVFAEYNGEYVKKIFTSIGEEYPLAS